MQKKSTDVERVAFQLGHEICRLAHNHSTTNQTGHSRLQIGFDLTYAGQTK